MTENITRIVDLRVGDIVRLEGGAWRGHPAEGVEYAVEALISDHEARVGGSWYIYDEPGTRWPFTFVRRPGEEAEETQAAEENTPAVPEGLTFERYHESMFPMIETLSKAAEEAGYCSEYDRMARSVGAPTRAEVRRIAAERDGARRRIAFPLTVNVIYDTEGTFTSEDAALNELRDKLASWGGIAEVVSQAIVNHRWAAVPEGGAIPEERVVTVL